MLFIYMGFVGAISQIIRLNAKIDSTWHTGGMNTSPLKHFLVGGAVRDQLLDEPVTDRDWVVVGATPDDMIDRGYRQVGADFPVFLHPTSGEEYALARTERKSGQGYQGFICDFSTGVTLEDDLERRDLTINAMAMDEQGQLIDPYGGARDLADRMLRHVSPAFSEDPLRVIRVARFAARFYRQGFSIAPETLALMTQMVRSGELETLTPQRTWQDTVKALETDTPSVFFSVLRQVGALKVIMPEVDALFGVPQSMAYHPEVDTGVHLLQALDRAAQLTDRLDTRFAVLCHDLGKALTPADVLPGHAGHEMRGLEPIDTLCERLHVSKRLHQLARLTAQWHTHCHRLPTLKPATVLKVLEAFRALQNDDQLRGFVLACQADAQGRSGCENTPYPQAEELLVAREAAAQVSSQPLLDAGLRGPELGEALRRERIKAIAAVHIRAI